MRPASGRRLVTLRKTARSFSQTLLGRRAPDVLSARTFGPFAKIEFHAVALAQIVEALALYGALVEEVFLPRLVLDEPEPLFQSYRANRSCHGAPFCLAVRLKINVAPRGAEVAGLSRRILEGGTDNWCVPEVVFGRRLREDYRHADYTRVRGATRLFHSARSETASNSLYFLTVNVLLGTKPYFVTPRSRATPE